MAQHRAPKQWQLTRNESISSYESWRQNLLYVLTLDPLFTRFLAEGTRWEKKTAQTPHRGLRDDGDGIPADVRLTGAQKSAILDLMLGQIANFCPVIARNTIVKNSTSLGSIWAQIRQHYGFQASGARFLDLASVKLEPDEKPEDLFQRLQAFFQDNLLTVNGGITHGGEAPNVDEDMTPTLENTIVCLWLQMIRPGLPNLVKQKYGAELRNQTLASLRPEISAALDSLIEELNATEEAKVFRTFAGSRNASSRQQTKICTLCKAAKRPLFNTHYISECKFLPTSDRRAIARSRTHDIDEDDNVETPPAEPVKEEHESPYLDQHEVRRVNIVQSPFIYAFFKDHRVRLTLDSGATTNMVRAAVASHIGLPVTPASQMAQQADGCTPLTVVGETHCVLSRGSRTFQLDALVVDKLDVDFLAGSPFMDINDIGIRIARRQIIIGGQECIQYNDQLTHRAAARRTQSFVARAPKCQTVILPGEYVEAEVPDDCSPDGTWALQPRYDSKRNQEAQCTWPPPQEVEAVDHHIRIANTSSEPILLKKGEHFGQVNEVRNATSSESDYTVPKQPARVEKTQSHPEQVIDPDGILPLSIKNEFVKLHQCQSLKLVPNTFKEQTTSNPPECIGSSFATDVMRLCKQMIPVLRETVSSYTLTSFVKSEKHDDLVQSVLSLAASVRTLGDQPMVIHTDNAPGFQTMAHNPVVVQQNIRIELGQVKNINKNPIAERAIDELGREILHIAPIGGAVSELILVLATANLNSRIRKCGLSAREESGDDFDATHNNDLHQHGGSIDHPQNHVAQYSEPEDDVDQNAEMNESATTNHPPSPVQALVRPPEG
jgi:hypothetical protein